MFGVRILGILCAAGVCGEVTPSNRRCGWNWLSHAAVPLCNLLDDGQESNHNHPRGGVSRVDVLQNRNLMMDQQKKRRRLLISIFVLLGMAILNLVFMFWAFFDGEKLNKGLLAIPCILVALAVGNLSRLKRLQKGPTPPDPK